MEDLQIFLIGFGIFNLCLLIFCRPLSRLVLVFFATGRRVCPPEEAERRAAKMGFQGAFTNPEIAGPSRKRTIQFLALTGGINFLGSVAIYFLITSGSFNETRAEDGRGQPATRSEPKPEGGD